MLPGFHAKEFKTLLAFLHGNKADLDTNRQSKCALNIQKRGRSDVIPNPHYMQLECNGKDNVFIEHNYSLLRVNHYVDNFEVFFMKNDARCTKEVTKHSHLNVSYEIGWINIFFILFMWNRYFMKELVLII